MFNKIINRLDRILSLKIEFRNPSQIKQVTNKILVKDSKIKPTNKLVLLHRLISLLKYLKIKHIIILNKDRM